MNGLLFSAMTESVVFVTTCISILYDAVLAVSVDQTGIMLAYPTNHMMSPEVNSKVYIHNPSQEVVKTRGAILV